MSVQQRVDKLGISKGEFKYVEEISSVIDLSDIGVVLNFLNPNLNGKQIDANGLLVVDTLNTANQCGYTPSELLKQNEALKNDRKADLKKFLYFLKAEGIVIEEEHKPQDFDFLYDVWSGKNPDGLL